MLGNLSLMIKLGKWWKSFIALLNGETARSSIDPRDPLTIQYYLNRKGYWNRMDGRMGPETIRAIKKFQSDNKLASDGLVGKLTWAKLSEGVH